jgi:hypothetical protein
MGRRPRTSLRSRWPGTTAHCQCASYFNDPSRNGGLKADLITDPTELRQFTAFVT